jgi:hypothetical protein
MTPDLALGPFTVFSGRFLRNAAGTACGLDMPPAKAIRILDLAIRSNNATRTKIEIRSNIMQDTSQIREHMNVLGSDGRHIGTVDRIKGEKIILTKNDPMSHGKHHAIPAEWVSSVDQNEVRLNQTTEEAFTNWMDAEKSGDRTVTMSYPELGLVAATRGALGVGLGLLLSNALSRNKRKAIGLPLFIGGVLSSIPIGMHIFHKKPSETEH